MVPHATLVFTKWTPDPNATAGPEPGYLPSLTGLTGSDIKTASAVIDSNGVGWQVNVSFTVRGADLLKQLTRENVAACGDASADCPQRHLGIWLNLVQRDIANWDDSGYAAKVSRPYDLNCLVQAVAGVVCPKLVGDPTTLQEIDGGSMAITGAFTQPTATELASVLNASR